MAQSLTQSLTGGVELHEYDAGGVNPSTVLVKFLAAPINPLDLLVLAGTYPVKPTHHYQGQAIPGYDGIGEVVECGEGVTKVTPGDLVVPSKFGTGTWRTHAVLDASSLQKISRPNDLAFGAMLKLGVLPAYFLLEDMATLKPGDWIIQNAATSVVAQWVVQFARLRGIRSISIIRDRETASVTQIKQSLCSLGADLVLTENELPEQIPAILNNPVKLALDSVFGPSARLLLDCLAVGGTFVQLGFLGGASQELQLSSKDLFVRQLQLRGFRGTAQLAKRTAEEQSALMDWTIRLFNNGALTLPALGLERLEWTVADGSENKVRLLTAIDRANKAVLGQRKQILVFT
ncbi:hypothetical protein MMC07_004777 [Pseudocyphellaria aurata]|nr:hypothetical protein [Pseudocyphellaria aurata]